MSILIPVLNELDLTIRCFESIRRFAPPASEVIFIDNGSGEDMQAWLKRCQEKNGSERVKVIRNEENLGFAKAINQGAKIARGDILVFNNDAELVRAGSIELLLESLYNEDSVGAVGPTTDFCLGPQHHEQNGIYPPLHQVRFLIGFCILVKREVWDAAGGMDEGYPMTGEDDLDLSLQIQKLGRALVCDRRVFVHHLGGATQQNVFDRYQEKYREAQQEGRAKLVEKWGEEPVKALFEPVDFSRFKVMVAIPTYVGVQPEAYANHLDVISSEMRHGEKTGLRLVLRPLLRSAIVCARNEVARQAVKEGCTHVFFMDDDMIMPPSAIHRLLAHQKPIVSGLCHLRTPPFFPSMFMNDRGSREGRIFYLKNWPRNQLIEVDAVGMACVLIETEVFKQITELEVEGNEAQCPKCEQTFVPEPLKPKGSDVFYLYGRARPGEMTVGEDVHFCHLAQEAGFKVHVDTSIKFGHLGMPIVYNEEYFDHVAKHHDLAGIEYSTADDTRRRIREIESAKERERNGPAGVASYGLDGEAAERAVELYAGIIGDGKHPGDKKEPGLQPV